MPSNVLFCLTNSPKLMVSKIVAARSIFWLCCFGTKFFFGADWRTLTCFISVSIWTFSFLRWFISHCQKDKNWLLKLLAKHRDPFNRLILNKSSKKTMWLSLCRDWFARCTPKYLSIQACAVFKVFQKCYWSDLVAVVTFTENWLWNETKMLNCHQITRKGDVWKGGVWFYSGRLVNSCGTRDGLFTCV